MQKIVDKKYMRAAIREARKNLKRMYGGPFGVCVVKNDKVIAVSRNTVLKYNDATCHAEINAIMCFSAIHWARFNAFVYGTAIKDAAKIGFNEMPVSNAILKRLGRSRVRIIRGSLVGECRKLLKEYDRLPNKKVY
ncbi:MAG: nucleoside deaminase [Candidatus Omnitrophica bacterium]|nr:nucleoside deaminase [Candidatus Omnitrophota bacterium]